jgi:hypothetical protein
MQPVAEHYKAPSKIHEEVVKNLRKEKDYVASAYSNEKGNRMRLQEELRNTECLFKKESFGTFAFKTNVWWTQSEPQSGRSKSSRHAIWS